MDTRTGPKTFGHDEQHQLQHAEELGTRNGGGQGLPACAGKLKLSHRSALKPSSCWMLEAQTQDRPGELVCIVDRAGYEGVIWV